MGKVQIIITLFLFMLSCNKQENNLPFNNSENERILNCNYQKLSNQFNVEFQFDLNHRVFVIDILNKSNQSLSKIESKTNISVEDVEMFNNCNNLKSLSTKFQLNKKFNMDLYDGNIVVGDYNFDGLDDIAIFRDRDLLNRKLYYEYFLQNKEGDFYKDDFLSSLNYYDKKFDIYKSQIVINSGEDIKEYRYDDNKWVISFKEKGLLVKKGDTYDLYGFQSPIFPISIYDNNNRKVGYVKEHPESSWVGFVNLNNISFEIMEDVNKPDYTSDIQSIYFKYETEGYIIEEKIGERLYFRKNGDYYLKESEVNSSGLFYKKLSKALQENFVVDIPTKKKSIQLYEQPSVNSKVIFVSEIGFDYSHNFTGRIDGQWMEVEIDHKYILQGGVSPIVYSEEIYYKGWIKIFDEKGNINIEYTVPKSG